MTFDDGQAEDEENSLPHMDGFQSKLPPGILPHGLPQVKEVQPAVTQVEQEKEKEKPKEGDSSFVLNYTKQSLSYPNLLSIFVESNRNSFHCDQTIQLII